VECRNLYALNYSELVLRVDLFNNVEFGLWSESSCHAPFVRGVIVLLIYVVLDYGQLLLGLLCRVGCRHLHVPQNSRQP
jgi:hypothetical protein